MDVNRYIDKIKRCKKFSKRLFLFLHTRNNKKNISNKRQHKQNKQKKFKNCFFLNITKQNKIFSFTKMPWYI